LYMSLYGKRYTILYRFILFYMFKWREVNVMLYKKVRMYYIDNFYFNYQYNEPVNKIMKKNIICSEYRDDFIDLLDSVKKLRTNNVFILNFMPRLEHVILDKAIIPKIHMICNKPMMNLRSIVFIGCLVNDKFSLKFDKLYFPMLQKIEMQHGGIIYKQIYYEHYIIASMLENVEELINVKMSNDNLKQLINLKKYVSLSNYGLDNLSVTLQHLDVGSGNTKMIDYEHLEKFKNLKYLKTGILTNIQNKILRLPELTHLELNNYNQSNLDNINLPNLEHLCYIGSAISLCNRFTKLKSLNINSSNDNINFGNCTCESLEKLFLRGNIQSVTFKDDMSLRYLELNCVWNINEQILLPHLETLKICITNRDNVINIKNMQNLVCPNLQQLYIEFVYMMTDFNYLVEFLQNCRSIKKITIDTFYKNINCDISNILFDNLEYLSTQIFLSNKIIDLQMPNLKYLHLVNMNEQEDINDIFIKFDKLVEITIRNQVYFDRSSFPKSLRRINILDPKMTYYV